ncbi:MAG: 3'-5' exonuclease [bacterium]
MYLFFDTETTGLPKNWKAAITDVDNWPRIVQLAWQLYDKNGVLQMECERIIKPVGFVIPTQASDIHGVTTERALRDGVELKEALLEFADVLSVSEHLVAHNIDFDHSVMGAEFIRTNIPLDLFSLNRVDTMKSTTELLKLPGRFGYKYPNLMELHNYLFNEGFDGAHDALVDVRACARCFFELQKQGVL